VKNGHVIDIFSCSLDQTGLFEMRSCFNSSNGFFSLISWFQADLSFQNLGHVIMADSFESALFKQSFHKVFEKDEQGHLKMGFNVTLEVIFW
jgi:protein transport protein SEC23